MIPYFPFDEFRKGQKDMFDFIYENLNNNTISFVHAPTGIGKTASSLGSALKYAQENNAKVMFLTNRHEHHNIVFDTIRKINKKYSTSFKVANFLNKRLLCNQKFSSRDIGDFHDYCKNLRKRKLCYFYENTYRNGVLSVNARVVLNSILDHHIIRAEHSKKVIEDFCPYEILLEAVKHVDVIIADYYYVFNETISTSFFSKAGLKLKDVVVIVDEAHNLPERVMRMNDSKFSIISFKNAFKEVVKYYADLENLLLSLAVDIESFIRSKVIKSNEVYVDKDDVISIIRQHINYEDLVDVLYDVGEKVHLENNKSYANSFAKFLEFWESEGKSIFHVAGFDEKKRWYLRVFDVDVSSRISSPLMLSKGAVVMSATLMPTTMYRQIFGVYERSKDLILKSPFPHHNTLLYVVDGLTTKYEFRDDDMMRIYGNAISVVINNLKNNIIVFFPSYEVIDHIKKHIVFNDGKLIIEETRDLTKEEKSRILEVMRNNRNVVLFAVVGANFYEGVDFKGEMAQVAVIVGIPFDKPDLYTKAVVKYYDALYNKGFEYGYIIPTLNRVLQSSGRVVRSENERGVIFLLDSRYRKYDSFIRSRYESILYVNHSELINEIIHVNNFLNQPSKLSAFSSK